MTEQIDRWFCACASYPDDPGMVVCWKCEQPLAEVDPDGDTNDVLTSNLLLLGIRYRKALEHYADPQSWLNEREHRGVPGFHSRAWAMRALTPAFNETETR